MFAAASERIGDRLTLKIKQHQEAQLIIIVDFKTSITLVAAYGLGGFRSSESEVREMKKKQKKK